MPPHNTRFVTVDPSKRPERKDKSNSLRCQTCFNKFKTHEELRHHIADYQLEAQSLIARLLEVQAHLPREHYSLEGRTRRLEDYEADCFVSDLDAENEENESVDSLEFLQDSEDEDKAYSRVQNGQDTHHTPMKCPHSGCLDKTGFGRKADLERHFQSHVLCNEICIYCRQSFQQARKYIRHRCPNQDGNDEAKECYRKERCTQLRRVSAERLGSLVKSEPRQSRQSKKRVFDGRASGPSKMPKTNETREDNDSRVIGEEFNGPPDTGDIVRTPLLGLQYLNAHPYASKDECNTSLSSKVAPAAQMEQTFDSLIAQPYAPIFEDITITPCYDLVQESYAFSSSLQGVNFLTDPVDDARSLQCSSRS